MQFSGILIGTIAAVLIRKSLIHAYKWWFRRGLVGDASVHFAIIRQLKKNINSRYIEQYLISPEPMAYPTAFHKFARIFPISTINKKPYAPNLYLFGLFSVVFLTYIIYLNSFVLQGYAFSYTIFFLIFLASPSSLVFSGPAITYIGLSERLLARLSCSMSYLCVSMGLLFNDAISLSLSLIFGSLSLLSSIFARQVILFTFPLLSFLFLDWRPLVLVVGMFFIALGIGGKHFFRSFSHTINHWRCYRLYTKRSAVVRKNLTNFFKWEFQDGRISLRDISRNLLTKDPTRTFFLYPEISLAVCFLLMSGQNYQVIFKIFAPIFCTLIIYFITLSDRFNHLGEAYRYIDYSNYYLFPVIVTIGSEGLPEFWLKTGLLCYLTISVTLTIFTLYSNRKNQLSSYDHLTDFLNHLSNINHAVVYPIPMRLGAEIIARRENWKSFWWQPGLQLDAIFDEFIEEYPYLKKDWDGLFEKYSVTHVICEKKSLGQTNWKYDFSGLEIILEDEYYQAYRVSGNTT